MVVAGSMNFHHGVVSVISIKNKTPRLSDGNGCPAADLVTPFAQFS